MKSTFGAGSVFTMRLPMIAPANLAEPLTALAPAAAGAAGPKEAPSIVSENIVLVIDDSPTGGSLFADMIGPERVCVVHAASGAEGVELARDLLPELIFLDLLVPDMDGWQVLATLKADRDLAHIPVVIFSADGQEQRGAALGAADVIAGPIDQVSLEVALRWLPEPKPQSDPRPRTQAPHG